MKDLVSHYEFCKYKCREWHSYSREWKKTEKLFAVSCKPYRNIWECENEKKIGGDHELSMSCIIKYNWWVSLSFTGAYKHKIGIHNRTKLFCFKCSKWVSTHEHMQYLLEYFGLQNYTVYSWWSMKSLFEMQWALVSTSESYCIVIVQCNEHWRAHTSKDAYSHFHWILPF